MLHTGWLSLPSPASYSQYFWQLLYWTKLCRTFSDWVTCPRKGRLLRFQSNSTATSVFRWQCAKAWKLFWIDSNQSLLPNWLQMKCNVWKPCKDMRGRRPLLCGQNLPVLGPLAGAGWINGFALTGRTSIFDLNIFKQSGWICHWE